MQHLSKSSRRSPRGQSGYVLRSGDACKSGKQQKKLFCCQNGHLILDPLEPKDGYNPDNDADYEFIPSIILGPKGAQFIREIRSYNNALAIVSHSVRFDEKLLAQRGIRVFRIHGRFIHYSSSLRPPEGLPPKYASLYILDPEEALRERLNQHADRHLDPTILRQLQEFLYRVNPLVREFQFLREKPNLLNPYVFIL